MAEEAKDMIADDEEKNVNNGFDDNIFKMLAKENKDSKSLILSPLSILVAMTVAMCGAANNTLKELLDVLYPNIKNKELTFDNASKITSQMIQVCKRFNADYNGDGDIPLVRIANKIWLNKKFKMLDSYIQATDDCVDSIDISNPEQAAGLINKWCAEQTNNMIKQVVNKNAMAKCVLLIANAIYFKGQFKQPFNKKLTADNTSFFADYKYDKRINRVSMMRVLKECRWFKQGVKDTFDIVKLPYKSSKLSLVLVINTKGGEKQLSSVDIFSMNDNNEWNNGKLNLFVPKFKFEYEIQLQDLLKAMGIRDAFSNSADFSGMNGKNDLLIDAVIHKAVIEVDETGTEAAAVTVVKSRYRNASNRRKRNIPTIRFDHPFDFYIVDERLKFALFSGRYVGK